MSDHPALLDARKIISNFLRNENSPGMCEPDLDVHVQVRYPKIAADEILQILLDQGWQPPAGNSK